VSEALDPVADRAKLRRAILASLAGNMLEWYDFFLFGTASALIFNRLFFAPGDPASALLAAFTIYAVGFFARPVGGILFGHIGDRMGRKVSLVWTLSIMGGATFAIGLLPTYAQIGMAAPALLVVLRLLQGLAAGGEWGGGVLMVTENSAAHRRGFLGSWSQAGVGLGFVVASLVFLAVRQLPEADFLSWGWRIPFLVSIVIFAVGAYIRFRVTETATHIDRAEKPHHTPLGLLLRRHPRELLIGVGLRLAENGGSQLFVTFSLAYGTAVGAPTDILLLGLILGMLADSAMMPVFGALSDRIGRKPVYMAGIVGLAAFGYPFLAMLNSGSSTQILAAFIIGNGLFHAAMIGVQPAMFTEMFDQEVRYSGLAFVHEVSSVVLGFAPLIATALYTSTRSPVPVAVYLALLCLLSAIALLCWRPPSASRRLA
jgi:MFS transporter, MHS family, shikimate and dehydroshikimate transport protein